MEIFQNNLQLVTQKEQDWMERYTISFYLILLVLVILWASIWKQNIDPGIVNLISTRAWGVGVLSLFQTFLLRNEQKQWVKSLWFFLKLFGNIYTSKLLKTSHQWVPQLKISRWCFQNNNKFMDFLLIIYHRKAMFFTDF